MRKIFRLRYYKDGHSVFKEAVYPSLFEAKDNIPCGFDFKPDGIYNNAERFEISEEDSIVEEEPLKVIRTYSYVKT